jgi:PAS domain S-box-containing protein
MTWQFNSFGIIFLIAAMITGGVSVYAFRHQHVKGATSFIFLLLSVTIWAFFQALEYAVTEPAAKILCAKFQYLGIATIGSTWYLFSIGYSRGKKWAGKYYALLFILPALTILAAFTNEFHGLLWPKIEPVSSEAGSNLIYTHGPIFWAIFVYNYIFLALGTVTIIRTALNSREIYRWQMIGLIASAIIPWLGNLIYVLGLSPVAGLDLTPLGFVLSAFIIAWSIFFLRLFDLVPIARDQVVENLVDGVVVLDADSRIADINLKARELLGIQDNRAVGRNLVDFLKSWPELISRFQGVQVAQSEFYVGAGDVSDIHIRISPLQDDRNNPAGRIIVIRDISEQKKMERMRENLTHAIVHDLRNPLTSMALGLEMVRRQATAVLPKAQLDTLDLSRQSVQQMMELVDSILDIYRLESGEMPLNCKRVSLHTLATDAIRSVSVQANRKRLLLQLDIPEGMPGVVVDPNLLRRVLQNLLDNSVKYSMEGGVIRIQAGFEKGEGGVVISVSDTGAGMEESIKEKIFDKFVSGQNRTNGNGLGLTFCRLAVEAHGGRIWMDERHQGGTKISLTIPDRAET